MSSPQGVHKEMAKGAAWMTVLMISDRAIGLVSTLILVRLLVPEDFGIVAMCTSVVALLELFAAFGFDMVLINRQNATREHYDTAWTLSVIFGFLVALLLGVTAYPAAHFYQEPRVVMPMLILAAAFMIGSFENIAVVDFRKHMQFRKELILRLSTKAIGFCVTIPLAFALRSYWALVIGILSLNIARVVLGYSLKPYMPRFSLAQRRDILGFSSWMLLMNFAAFIRNRSSDFVIGRMIGAHGLGLFQVGHEVSSQPTTQLIAAVNRAAYPGYAKLSGDLQQLRQTFIHVITLIGIAALPVGLGISAISPLLVPVVLGPGWEDVIPILPILAMHGSLSAMVSNAQYVFYSIDRPKYGAAVPGIQALLMVPSLIIAMKYWGLTGAAWVVLGLLLVAIVPLQMLMYRVIGVRMRDWGRAVWRPTLASLSMYAFVSWFVGLGNTPTLLLLIAAIILGALVYIVAYILLLVAARDESTAERQFLRAYVEPRLKGWGIVVEF